MWWQPSWSEFLPPGGLCQDIFLLRDIGRWGSCQQKRFTGLRMTFSEITSVEHAHYWHLNQEPGFVHMQQGHYHYGVCSNLCHCSAFANPAGSQLNTMGLQCSLTLNFWDIALNVSLKLPPNMLTINPFCTSLLWRVMWLSCKNHLSLKVNFW